MVVRSVECVHTVNAQRVNEVRVSVVRTGLCNEDMGCAPDVTTIDVLENQSCTC